MKSLLLAFVLIFSCQNRVMRTPSSFDVGVEEDAFKIIYNLKLQIKLLQEKQASAKEIAALEKEVERHQQKITSEMKTLAPTPESLSFDYSNDWREQKDKFVIRDLEDFRIIDGKIKRVFQVDLDNLKTYEVGILNLVKGKDKHFFLRGDVQCEGDFKFNAQKNGFKISWNKKNSPKLKMLLTRESRACSLTFYEPNSPDQKYGVVITTGKSDKLARLKNKVDVCVLPESHNLSGMEKVFMSSEFDSMSCPLSVDAIKTLEIPVDGLKSKAEALLGKPLPEEFLKSGNPFLPLDFSSAPKLDAVLISYLVMRSDFYGTIIGRLVKWHADHGAQVRIMISDVITLDKDREMLYDLQSSSDNIKIQEYKYHFENGGLRDFIGVFHRTMHVKLLVTLSKEEEHNVVFFGGRNIHDGFVFKDIPDYSAFPKLVQYGPGKDDSWSYWRDFEMKVSSKELAERVASHYMTVWDRDKNSLVMRSLNMNFVTNKKLDPNYLDPNADHILVRHFVSMPFRDGHSLEKLYVKLFDDAHKTVRLSTPYFRPTKNVGAAMERAMARGVDISLITRIDLKGDTADIILGEVNKTGINKYLHKIKIYEYTEPNTILHSKLVLIDGKFSFIGSVNLNMRSFIHDTENGIMIYQADFNQRMNRIMDAYLKNTRPVEEKQKIVFWKKILIGTFDQEF
jgi:cardiolipin synthase